ncbi:hypothetical protein BGZ73_002961 [Actinomortierella ambigua]|nr:hypothetical protein BGZ73_002961 [Actinomortierella ambigua]
MPTATHSTSSAAATLADDSHEGIHLVVLQHGMWGYASHVKFIETQFKQSLGDRLCVYRARANESKYTYDGIDLCGIRLAEEIHAVIKVIEEGGSIEDMKGQKKRPSKKNPKTPSPSSSSPSSSSSSTTAQNSASTSTASLQSTTRPRKVTQFSYLGYSLGGLIGRFAIGVLETQKFFSPVSEGGSGIEPVYFITMATPHLGIRTPSQSHYSRLFNYLSARILSRTGEQLQLTDSYLPKDDLEDQQETPSSGKSPKNQSQHYGSHQGGGGVPLLVAMAEPGSIFLQALVRFKKRALYCNIRNDRSVPFWTGSFSDADPFQDLDTVNIQYHSKYSSLIESFEHLEQVLQSENVGSSNSDSDSDSDSDYDDTVADDAGRGSKKSSTTVIATDIEPSTAQNPQEEPACRRNQKKSKKDKKDKKDEKQKAWHRRLLDRIQAVPWRRYFIIGVVIPVALPFWVVIFTSAVTYQGIGSRFRTRSWLKDPAKVQGLEAIRQSVLEARRRRRREQSQQKPKSSQTLDTNKTPSTGTLLPTEDPAVVVDVELDCGCDVVIEQQQQQPQNSRDADQDAAALVGEACTVPTTTTIAPRSAMATPTTKTSRPQDTQDSTITLGGPAEEEEEREEEEDVSFCYPHLKTIRPLNLLPEQKEISRHLNEVEWVKNILHITAINAHASIVIREKRFKHDGGVAAVNHVVDMFKQDGEDE